VNDKPVDKVYEARRGHEGAEVLATVDGRPLYHVVWHSPTGFEMGYGGSGPADLALSILADYFGERPSREDFRDTTPQCWAHHHDFKFHFIAPHRDHLLITTTEIANWLARVERL